MCIVLGYTHGNAKMCNSFESAFDYSRRRKRLVIECSEENYHVDGPLGLGLNEEGGLWAGSS